MLQIDRNQTFIGQVLCLHLAGNPYPDLCAHDNPYVVKLVGVNLEGRFYPSDRTGNVFIKTRDKGAILSGPIYPADEVTYIPVVQLNWDEVQKATGEKYVVYNPEGTFLKRLISHDVHFRQRGGKPDVIGDYYGALYYKPKLGMFTLDRCRVPEKPADVLRAFADESRCDIGLLVFVPSG